VSSRSRRAVAIVVGAGALMSTLATSMLSVALPVLARDLGVPVGTAAWVMSGSLLSICTLLLPAGRLSERVGYARVYSAGFGVFAVGSILAAFSPTIVTLVLSRMVQGAGSAALMAVGPALLTSTFPREQRGRALGMQASMTYLGLTLGPTLGGLLTQAYGWRSVFGMNVAAAFLVGVLSLFALPRERGRSLEPFDRLGAVLFGASLVALVSGSSRSGEASTARHVILLGAGVVLAIVFLRHQRTAAAPLMPLSLFSRVEFSGGVLASYLHYVVIAMVSLLLPFHLQYDRGLTPRQAGWMMAIQPLTMACVAPMSGIVYDRIGARWPSTLGMMFLAAGVGGLAAGTDHDLRFLGVFLGLAGIGAGLFVTPNNGSILAAAPAERQGTASGFLAAARNVGMVSGIAVGGAVFDAVAPDGGAPALRTTLSIAAALAAVGAVIAPWRRVAA
jgi:EmrB/QacA subfamily drug resistance transporter